MCYCFKTSFTSLPKHTTNYVIIIVITKYVEILVEILETSASLAMISTHYPSKWGTAVAQWLRYCATNCKVTGLIPEGVIGIFH
jgi:hypothetical protein